MFFGLRRKTAVAALEEGATAIVEGRVFAAREIKAPGSGTGCVWFRSLAESYEVGARGRGRKMWVPKRMDVRSAGFYVQDDSGRVWVADDAEAFDVTGGAEEAGEIGKKGKQRYFNQLFAPGATVRVRGLVCAPKGSEPGEGLVLRPDAKGRLKIAVKS